MDKEEEGAGVVLLVLEDAGDEVANVAVEELVGARGLGGARSSYLVYFLRKRRLTTRWPLNSGPKSSSAVLGDGTLRTGTGPR